MARGYPDVPSYDVLGVRIHAVDAESAADVIVGWIAEGRRDYVVLTGAHGVVEMQSDAELRAINNAAGMTTPDGMPVVWLGRRHGFRGVGKVAAPDLMEAVFTRSVERGLRHFFYGGGEGVADLLVARLRDRWPTLAVAGVMTPPFRALTEDEVHATARTLDDARPDIVWCGLGCPKQERWMARFRPLVEAPVLVGVGAGFDHLAGIKPLAPSWIRHSGFEWLQRLLSEPRRLWPRYSRVVPRFLWGVVREELGRSKR
jgi:N-acetylglucosaminyldiphosphoundecaprenol N-acetyl-beta-D-mannosaminyltransferase